MVHISPAPQHIAKEHAVLILEEACKTHLIIDQEGRIVFEHLKTERILKKKGSKVELYLSSRFKTTKKVFNENAGKSGSVAAEIINKGFRVVYRIIDSKKYSAKGRQLLKKVFRS